jgi:hypothetical protein
MTTIRSIRIFSAAKVNALLYGILGLLAAPFFLLGPGLAMLGGSTRPAGVGGVIFLAAFLPFCYAIFGFITGALMAFTYNAIAHAVGGIEIELQTPPAPVIVNTPQTPLPSAGPTSKLGSSEPLETDPTPSS